MPKKGWIDWKHSEPKYRIIADLENGIIDLEESVHPTDLCWDFYENEPEFRHVVFDQFAARLKDHRAQVAKDNKRTALAKKAFDNYRKLHPENTHNRFGEPLWDTHPAKELLKDDIKNKKHVGKTPRQLRRTRREYKAFKLRVFRNHIYQEIRLIRFKNYLNNKRDEKEANNRERWKKQANKREKKRLEEKKAERKAAEKAKKEEETAKKKAAEKAKKQEETAKKDEKMEETEKTVTAAVEKAGTDKKVVKKKVTAKKKKTEVKKL